MGHRLKNEPWEIENPPHVAIIGIPEARGSRCLSVADGADSIRSHLYSLSNFPPEISITDLGNIRCGKEVKDTYAAVKMVAEELSEMGVRLLILGGSQELTVPFVKGFNREEFDLVIVDDRVDNSTDDKSAPDEFYINKLPPGTAVTLIAGQSYFVGDQAQDLLSRGPTAKCSPLERSVQILKNSSHC